MHDAIWESKRANRLSEGAETQKYPAQEIT